VAQKAGCPKAKLLQNAGEIVWDDFAGVGVLGLSAGASAPEVLVEEIIAAFSQRFNVVVEHVVTAMEDVTFKAPRALEDA
jgi:4-hydroxy-3-methylbut-2-en-1-yl diphosphate reductase